MLTFKNFVFLLVVCSLLFLDYGKLNKVFGLEESTASAGSVGSADSGVSLHKLNATQLVGAEPNCDIHCSEPSCDHGFELRKCNGCNCCYSCECDEHQCPYLQCPSGFAPKKRNEYDCCPTVCERICPTFCPSIRCLDGFLPYKGEKDCCPRCVSCTFFCDDEPDCSHGWHAAKRFPSDCCKTICVRDNDHDDCDHVDCPNISHCSNGYILRKDPTGPYGNCCNVCVPDCRNIFCPQIHCDEDQGQYPYTPRGECCKKCRHVSPQ